MAQAAQMKKRHWDLLASLLVLVAVPLIVAAVYLTAFAKDQYASYAGFTVRKEDSSAAVDILGGISQFTGGSNVDSSILYEFIRSQDLVARIDRKLDLASIYTLDGGADPLFSLADDALIEDKLDHWNRVVRISFDKGSGLIELRVLAFDAENARRVARAIVSESQQMINTLSQKAREDATRYARADLDEALARLKTAREALTEFRSRTQIVDPSADIRGQMGVLNNLQQQLAEALISADILSENTQRNDPRVRQAQRRIEVIRDRITEERRNFSLSEDSEGADYPALMAEYESLAVDREFAEETYRAALAALDVARSNADRQSMYLAAYIEPTLAETAEYPRRMMIIGLLALFLVLTWSVLVLIYYSIRDRR